MRNLMSAEMVFTSPARLQDVPKITVTVRTGRPGAGGMQDTRELTPVATADPRQAEHRTVN